MIAIFIRRRAAIRSVMDKMHIVRAARNRETLGFLSEGVGGLLLKLLPILVANGSRLTLPCFT